MTAQSLYTPAMLAAAMELANYPRFEEAAFHGTARSASCGSSLALDIALDPHKRVSRIGLAVRACAVGQASAAIFARHAQGRSIEELTTVHDELIGWLGNEGHAPDWPDVELIAPARNYRGRHGAMLLPWKAAIAALSSVATSG